MLLRDEFDLGFLSGMGLPRQFRHCDRGCRIKFRATCVAVVPRLAAALCFISHLGIVGFLDRYQLELQRPTLELLHSYRWSMATLDQCFI